MFLNWIAFLNYFYSFLKFFQKDLREENKRRRETFIYLERYNYIKRYRIYIRLSQGESKG